MPPTVTSRKVIPLTYRDIAWWAEAADGYRDVPLVIAEVEENGEPKLRVKKRSEVNEDQIVIDGIQTNSTPMANPNYPKAKITRVLVELDGDKDNLVECNAKDGTVCDSIFCTESSIEKFLCLYYHAQRLLTKEQWDDLLNAVIDPDVAVIGHVWPSSKVAVPRPGHEAGLKAEDLDETFYLLKKELGAITGFSWQGLSEYGRRRAPALTP